MGWDEITYTHLTLVCNLKTCKSSLDGYMAGTISSVQVINYVNYQTLPLLTIVNLGVEYNYVYKSKILLLDYASQPNYSL